MKETHNSVSHVPPSRNITHSTQFNKARQGTATQPTTNTPVGAHTRLQGATCCRDVDGVSSQQRHSGGLHVKQLAQQPQHRLC